jgi:hypothetical protein
MFGEITWDDVLSARLKKLWKTHTAAQIAAIFASEGYAVTRNSVIGRAHRMGLTGKNKSVVHRNTTKSVEPQRPKIARSKYNIVRR